MPATLYYLNTMLQLIEKPGFVDLDLLKKDDNIIAFWIVDFKNRLTGWDCLVEALSLGADIHTVKKLQKEWKCSDTDAYTYAYRIGCSIAESEFGFLVSQKHKSALKMFVGSGTNCLIALADICKKLGFKGNKQLKKSFAMLVAE